VRRPASEESPTSSRRWMPTCRLHAGLQASSRPVVVRLPQHGVSYLVHPSFTLTMRLLTGTPGPGPRLVVNASQPYLDVPLYVLPGAHYLKVARYRLVRLPAAPALEEGLNSSAAILLPSSLHGPQPRPRAAGSSPTCPWRRGLAPASRSILTTSSWPSAAARSSGVRP